MMKNRNENHFVITDGKRFIKKDISGRFTCTTSSNLADKYTQGMAFKVLTNSLTKTWRKTFYVAKIDGEELIKCSYLQNQTPLKSEAKEKFVLMDFFKDKNVKRWYERIEGLRGLVKDTQNRLSDVVNDIASIDRCLVDTSHVKRGKLLNASKGYKIYRMDHDFECKRTSLKNEKMLLEAINKRLAPISKELDEMFKEIDGFGEQAYCPRVLNELFEELFEKYTMLETDD